MRELHLFADRKAQPKRLVQGLRAANPVTELRETQGDTLTVFVHQFDRNPETPAVTPFIEKPLSASAIRASVGYIDAAPQSGTFKLKVGADTTASLTWPADLSTPVLIAAWKATVLAALNGLASVIALGGARLDDPAGTPGHIFYFTWLDAEATTVIEIVENRLIPWIEATVTGSAIPVGYSQMVKLARFPIRMSGAFAQATTPPVVMIETRVGGAGVNAVQTVSIPPGAIGSFSLTWNGAKTKTLDVTSVTAASLAAALNAIVVDGATNPSFRVETRAQREGKRFAVEFIGPLAGATQPDLGVTMYDQEGAPWWTGTLVLDGLGIEMALNGAPEVELTFELVITADGEETYLLPFVVENDMTAPQTLSVAEETGAILVHETIVYVPETDLTEYAEAAPGFSYTPAAAAEAFAITHNLNTRQPAVRVSYKYSESPERWRDFTINAEFFAESTSANAVAVAFPYALSSDTGSALYFGRFKIWIASPDSTIIIFSHEHTWEQIRESLPAGMTLAAKLALIDAALGIIGGSILIDAGNITGLLEGDQIDITSLVNQLKTNAAFSTAVTNVFGDAAALTTLINNLIASGNVVSLDALIEAILARLPVLTNWQNLITATLTENTAVRETIREAAFDALTNGVNTLPPGVIPFLLPPLRIAYPPPQSEPGPSTLVPGSGTTTKEETTIMGAAEGEVGNVTTRLATVQPNTEIRAGSAARFEPLPVALVSPAASSNLTGRVDPATLTENALYASTTAIYVRTVNGRRGRDYPTGTALGKRNGILYPVRADGSTHWPTEMEFSLVRLPAITAEALAASTRLLLEFQLRAQLQGNCNGRGEVVIETGALTHEAGATKDLNTFSWAETKAYEVQLSDLTGVFPFGVRVERAAGGSLTGLTSFAGRETAFTPPTLPFGIRAWWRRFDADNDTGERLGSLQLTVTGAFSYAPLE